MYVYKRVPNFWNTRNTPTANGSRLLHGQRACAWHLAVMGSGYWWVLLNINAYTIYIYVYNYKIYVYERWISLNPTSYGVYGFVWQLGILRKNAKVKCNDDNPSTWEKTHTQEKPTFESWWNPRIHQCPLWVKIGVSTCWAGLVNTIYTIYPIYPKPVVKALYDRW